MLENTSSAGSPRSAAYLDRTPDRPRRLLQETTYTDLWGNPGLQTELYAVGRYGRPWVDTAAKILTELRATPPHPMREVHQVRLLDRGAHTVLCQAGDVPT